MDTLPKAASGTENRLVVHTQTVAAPASVVFDTVADVEQWAQFFRPALHAEVLEQSPAHDVVRRWAHTGGTRVRVWTSRRELDRDGLRITFEQIDNAEPITGMGVEWIFKPVSDNETQVEVRHTIQATDAATADRVAEDTQAKGGRQLDSVRETAEHAEELGQLVLSFEDPLFAAGSAEDAYRILYEADKWPERLQHVDSLTMTEDVPNIQFFDMDTKTPDGSSHTTRSVRICLPHHKIVYKQIQLPKLLDAHTGHWAFKPTPEGVIISARHTVTIKPSAVTAILGPQATVQDARRYLRKVLSANSMKNLQLAKAYAEEQADG